MCGAVTAATAAAAACAVVADCVVTTTTTTTTYCFDMFSCEACEASKLLLRWNALNTAAAVAVSVEWEEGGWSEQCKTLCVSFSCSSVRHCDHL